MEFPNSLILPNVYMGNFPDNSPEDLPCLSAGSDAGVLLEQFYQTIYWVLKSSWTILTSFVYLCLLLWNSTVGIFTLNLYPYHQRYCVSLLLVLVFGPFSRILKQIVSKKKDITKLRGVQSYSFCIFVLFLINDFAHKILYDEMIFRGDVFFWHFS